MHAGETIAENRTAPNPHGKTTLVRVHCAREKPKIVHCSSSKNSGYWLHKGCSDSLINDGEVFEDTLSDNKGWQSEKDF
jgi:hypothetical protein